MDPLNHERQYRGAEAVRKLNQASVAICGAGAVGSNLAETLARQGVRRLRVVDRDRVGPENRATQVYGTGDVGAQKVAALKEFLFRATGAEIETHGKELTEANARKLLKGVDLVVDGFDNSAARRAVAEACRAESRPCLHVGLNADFAEVTWNERYRVPGDPEGGDVCNYPLARNLVVLVTAVAAEAVVRFLLTGARESYTVTLRDLRVNPEEEP